MLVFAFLLFLRLLLPIGNSPNSPDVLLDQHREHRYSHFSPTPHSESQQISFCVGYEIFDVTSIASCNRNDVGSASLRETCNVLHEAG